MQKRNLPNRKSIRLKGWDYRSPGLYYITICTKYGQHHFGEIRNSMMGLSVPGCIAWYFWRDIPNHQANIALDEFVVMPNHLHGIIGIKSSAGGVRTLHATSVHELHATSVHEHEEAKNKMAEISPKAGSLSAILRSYKSAITKWCNSHNHAYFGWHTRFYDHIVRNEKDLRRIRQYIFDNPINWERDRENNSGNEIHERGVEYMIGNDSNTRVQA